uniref:glutathione hydrolase 1 proenzyme-like isoform X1 n=1 Tax=Styela clava TaxID=7725 RepID=UPI00193A44EE|nr:glutathione hydrolase 1 proenzyme-like isoform X1 [Styela clava]
MNVPCIFNCVPSKMRTASTYKEFKSAAVVCNNPLSCTVGKNILLEGGSVVDAAIASMLTLGVVSFQSAGIGGGFFMIYYDATTGKDYFIDAKATAPSQASFDSFKDTESRRFARTLGGTSIATPGEVLGYWEAHQRFGKLPWSRLFEPAIHAAETGFEMTKSCGKWLTRMMRDTNKNEDLRNFLSWPNGTFKQAGDIIKNEKLAKTLRVIAKEGANAFYKGSLTDSILEDIRDGFGFPSTITSKDLEEYKVLIERSLKIKFDDFALVTTGAHGGGPVLAFILKILEGYNFDVDDLKNNEILTYHRIVEAMKFAFCKRVKLGDPNFHKEVNEIVNKMMSDKYCKTVREKIDDFQTHPKEYYQDSSFATVPDKPGTAHLNVIGEDGSAVSMTSSITYAFGSNILGQRTGILFNNQNCAFTIDTRENSNNTIEPGKRALSSTTPAIILKKSSDGTKVKMITGGAGSSRIINSIAMTIMQHFWFGKSIDEAVRSKRLHHAWEPNILYVQEGTKEEIMRGLKDLGHEVDVEQDFLTSVQTIARLDDGTIAAKCDDRRESSPDGY